MTSVEYKQYIPVCHSTSYNKFVHLPKLETKV